MRPAGAIRTPEPANSRPGSRYLLNRHGPFVLAVFLSVRVPDRDDLKTRSEVVNVPVHALFRRKVSFHPGENAAGSMGTPHVNIVPRGEIYISQCTDENGFPLWAV